jgi:hypothetical protein
MSLFSKLQSAPLSKLFRFGLLFIVPVVLISPLVFLSGGDDVGLTLLFSTLFLFVAMFFPKFFSRFESVSRFKFAWFLMLISAPTAAILIGGNLYYAYTWIPTPGAIYYSNPRLELQVAGYGLMLAVGVFVYAYLVSVSRWGRIHSLITLCILFIPTNLYFILSILYGTLDDVDHFYMLGSVFFMLACAAPFFLISILSAGKQIFKKLIKVKPVEGNPR